MTSTDSRTDSRTGVTSTDSRTGEGGGDVTSNDSRTGDADATSTAVSTGEVIGRCAPAATCGGTRAVVTVNDGACEAGAGCVANKGDSGEPVISRENG